jgi:hypothetical protein
MSVGMTGNAGFKNAAGSHAGKSVKGYVKGEMSQFTPEQTKLFKNLFSQMGSDTFLGKLASGDQSQFEQLEAPAWRQFGDVQANIANRFSGMGSGARRSSGFKNAQSGAGMEFLEKLQSQRMGIQQDAIKSLWDMSQQLLGQRPYEQFLVPKQKTFGQELAISGLGGLAQGVGSGLTGGMGNAGGTWLKNLLGGK